MITTKDFDLANMRDVTLYGKNATFNTAVTLADLANNALVQEVVAWLGSNLNAERASQLVNLRLYGSHGVAKSSLPRAVLTSLSGVVKEITGKRLVVHVVPLTSMSPDVTVFPTAATDDEGRRILRQRLLDAWTDPDVWHAFIWEEPSRAKAAARNAMLAVLTTGKLGGVEIPNYIGSIVTDNEGAEFGISASPDFTFLNRFEHVEVTWRDAPWARYLADQFPHRDLGRLITTYSDPNVLTDNARSLYLTPRTLEHIVFNLDAGMPAEWGMPDRVGEQKVRIIEDVLETGFDGKRRKTGTRDVTDDVMNALAFAMGVSQPSRVPDKYRTAIKLGVRHSRTVHIEGAPGIAKTAAAVEAVREEMPEAEIFYASMAEVNPENWFLPLQDKGTGHIDLYLTEEILTADVIILDEIWRAKGAARHQMMEMLQEKTFAGMPLKARSIIAMNNPKKLGELTLDTGVPDRAQADRFFINVRVAVADIPSGDWLAATYGKDGEDVLDWWSNDLPDEVRPLVTRRNLEMLISRNRRGVPLLPALTRFKGQYFGEPELHLLQRRFAGRKVATLAGIVAELDCSPAAHAADGTCTADHANQGWICKLERGELEAAPEHLAVGKALFDAAMPILEANQDAIVRLMTVLGQQQRRNLVMRSPSQDKATFFANALRAAKAQKAA